MQSQTIIRAVTWTAPSDRGGATYRVSAPSPDDALSCTCPARTAACKHIRRALAGELGKPRVRVTVRPDYRVRLSESVRRLQSFREV